MNARFVTVVETMESTGSEGNLMQVNVPQGSKLIAAWMSENGYVATFLFQCTPTARTVTTCIFGSLVMNNEVNFNEAAGWEFFGSQDSDGDAWVLGAQVADARPDVVDEVADLLERGYERRDWTLVADALDVIVRNGAG